MDSSGSPISIFTIGELSKSGIIKTCPCPVLMETMCPFFQKFANIFISFFEHCSDPSSLLLNWDSFF